MGFGVFHFQRWHRSSAQKIVGNLSKTSKCDYDADDNDVQSDDDHENDQDAHNDNANDNNEDAADKVGKSIKNLC